MKKIMLALLACAALTGFTGAQESQLSQGTAGLIEDGVIDDLAFGITDYEGLFFTAYKDPNLELGWGQYFLDDESLWISVYDRCSYSSDEQGEKEIVYHSYGTTDGINVDYIDTTRQKIVIDGDNSQRNLFAVGIALNNKIGFQPFWEAIYSNAKSPVIIYPGKELDPSDTTDTIEQDSTSTPTATTMKAKFSDVKNIFSAHDFGINFKGLSTPKLFNDHELYFKLNTISLALVSIDSSTKYSMTENISGSTVESDKADGILASTGILPAFNMEMGMVLGELGPATVNFELEEEFGFGFELAESKTSYTEVSESATARTTESTDFEKSYGDCFMWNNILTPKVIFDFDVDERITLKARAKVEISFDHLSDDDDVETVTRTETLYDKTSGSSVSTKSIVKKGSGDQNLHTDTFSITPEFDLGFVYQAVPERLNLNFGLTLTTGAYTWKKTEYTNANENKVSTTEITDDLGNTSTATVVEVDTGDPESTTRTYSNGKSTATLYVGATWFFSEDVKLDVYYANNSKTFFSSDNVFGIDFSIRY